MLSITLKNIPENLYDEIKRSAVDNYRSINCEILIRLNQSLSAEKRNPDAIIADIEKMQSRINIPPLTDVFINQAKNEGRPF